MSIKIKATKEVNEKGEWGYRVKSVSALTKNEVPNLYLERIPHCYEERYINGIKRITINTKRETFSLQEGEFYTEKEFNTRIKLIKQCGKTLREVNIYLKINRQMWFGEVEIEI